MMLVRKFLLSLVLLLVIPACCLLPAAYSQEKLSSKDLIAKAWEAHGKRDVEATFEYTNECIDLYKDEAGKLQAWLKALPKAKEEIEAVQALNDVGVAYFIQGEVYMRQEKFEEAKRAFKIIIDKYAYAQAWDQFGWYWQVAEVARQSIKKIETGSNELEKEKKLVSQIPTKISLSDSGKETFVDYAKYGEFQNIGTKDYKYLVKDQEGLSSAVGEGVYPNTASIRKDPQFKQALKEKRLDGDLWDFMHSPDLEAAFFKWATASEPQGVKLFYLGLILEKSGLVEHAIKCYYAIVVHFPGAYGWTYFKTPWYVGQAAISKIDFLLRRNPQLGHKLIDADIKIVNGFDNNVANDIVITSPGRFVKAGPAEKSKSKTGAELKIKKRRGQGKVHLVQYASGDWQLIVDGKPYIIKGITYAPTKVGQSPHDGTLGNWMDEDSDKNGKADGPYDSFVDKNGNNIQDPDEPAVGDFKLMQLMGVNTIRLYHHPLKINREILRDLYKNYGIRVIIGDFLGVYALGSGASWSAGTDYSNAEQRKNMLDSVRQMVSELKDEPYILFWLLGNENIYGVANNSKQDPDTYFKFANDIAKEIKAMDPEHPVAICSGDILFLDKFGKDSPDIDIFGANAYRGDYGFGFLWRQVRDQADRAAFITEYGCPAYAEGRSEEEAEGLQSEYLQAAWEDIYNNSAFQGQAGNAIGGILFEWLDEWWKAYEPYIHDTKGLWIGPFPDGTMHEEWLGVLSQGDGKNSPFLRKARKAYYTFQKMWG